MNRVHWVRRGGENGEGGKNIPVWLKCREQARGKEDEPGACPEHRAGGPSICGIISMYESLRAMPKF